MRKVLALGLLGIAAVVCTGGGCRYVPSAEEKQFLADLGKTTITVYPAYIRGRPANRYDKAAAEKIAAWLNEHKLADARVVDEQVPITGGISYDESRMWRESRDALAAYVKSRPPETQYALVAEYLGVNEGNPNVGCVHCYVVTRDGAFAYGILQNSHQDTFRAIKPRNADDCTRVVLDQMQKDLVEARNAEAGGSNADKSAE